MPLAQKILETGVCDKYPCPWLAAAIRTLIIPSSNSKNFEIVSEVQIPNATIKRMGVPLVYCPFCGTRIDPEWVKDLKVHGRIR